MKPSIQHIHNSLSLATFQRCGRYMGRLGIILVVIVLSVNTADAQRRVTPVNNAATETQSINENKLPADSIDRSKLIKYRDDKGNIVLVDTISGREFVDSTSLPVVPPMIYPLVFDASVGVNLWDPVMRLFGQKHGIIGFSAHFNMHNRYIPAIEIGLGEARDTPPDNNYTYQSKMAPYFKIGIDYNFLYNSNPDYMIFAGTRYGFSAFNWTLKDVTSNGSYWGEPNTIQFPNINAKAGYLEFLLGIKVKIYKRISMGWTLRYHKVLHQSPIMNGKAWYIPGYGTTGSPLSASISLYYTLPIHTKSIIPDNTNPVITPGETPMGDDTETTASTPGETPIPNKDIN